MANDIRIDNWKVDVDGEYVFLRHKDHGGVIQLKADEFGYVVDIWDNTEEISVASTYAEYNELSVE